MSASGWCTAPPGARPRHADCRAAVCDCPCHDPERKAD